MTSAAPGTYVQRHTMRSEVLQTVIAPGMPATRDETAWRATTLQIRHFSAKSRIANPWESAPVAESQGSGNARNPGGIRHPGASRTRPRALAVANPAFDSQSCNAASLHPAKRSASVTFRHRIRQINVTRVSTPTRLAEEARPESIAPRRLLRHQEPFLQNPGAQAGFHQGIGPFVFQNGADRIS